MIINSNRKIVLNESRAFFDQIVATREWNAIHGGVYTIINERNLPNLFLVDSLRDIESTNGLKLTKINPAYMTRQISEISEKKYNKRFKITSLNPIRPGNMADPWETKSLQSFESGIPFAFELVDSSNQYRYMAPLVTENSCLKCHAKQGYNVGDIRGGISVTTPDTFYKKLIKKQLINSTIIHLIVFLFGLSGLLFFYRRIKYLFLIILNKNNQLENLNATKDKLFSIIAHDLKNPISSILGLSVMMQERIKENNTSNFDKLLESINSASQSTYNLLDNLLIWAKMQTGKLQFKPEKLNLKNILDDTIIIYKANALAKKINLKYEHIENVNVFADKNMLMTILRNLISNAIKFSKVNGKIRITSETNNNCLVITVSDNGVGINKEVQMKLFKNDETISTKGTINEEGSGLGLILCKEFVEKHGGTIWVESEPGIGSDFKFLLPQKEE